VASPQACAAFAQIPGASQCSLNRAFSLANGYYFYYGLAAELNMGPAPACTT
jgi:hypothetical protein